MTTITEVANALQRKYKFELGEYASVNKLRTGLVNLDKVLKGGLPIGRLVEFFGTPGGGKSSLALHVLSQHPDLPAAIIDIERGTDMNATCARHGITNTPIYFKPDYGEQAFEFTLEAIENGVKLIIFDSLGLVQPKNSMENSPEEGVRVGGQAKLITECMPKVVAAADNNQALVMFINQRRDKIGAMGNASPATTPGGWGSQHCMSVRLELTRKGWIEQTQSNCGGITSGLHITKSKWGGAHTRLDIDIFDDRGPDPYAAMKYQLEVDKMLVKAGSWFRFEPSLGQELGFTANIGQGLNGVIKFFQEHPDVYENLYERLLAPPEE